jgi:hypothetical protein
MSNLLSRTLDVDILPYSASVAVDFDTGQFDHKRMHMDADVTSPTFAATRQTTYKFTLEQHSSIVRSITWPGNIIFPYAELQVNTDLDSTTTFQMDYDGTNFVMRDTATAKVIHDEFFAPIVAITPADTFVSIATLADKFKPMQRGDLIILGTITGGRKSVCMMSYGANTHEFELGENDEAWEFRVITETDIQVKCVPSAAFSLDHLKIIRTP